jgi:hypothetical protein
MNHLAGVGDARKGGNAAADRFDIGRARAGLCPAEFLNQSGILALGFGNFARVEKAGPCALAGARATTLAANSSTALRMRFSIAPVNIEWRF